MVVEVMVAVIVAVVTVVVVMLAEIVIKLTCSSTHIEAASFLALKHGTSSPY